MPVIANRSMPIRQMAPDIQCQVRAWRFQKPTVASFPTKPDPEPSRAGLSDLAETKRNFTTGGARKCKPEAPQLPQLREICKSFSFADCEILRMRMVCKNLVANHSQSL